MSSLSPRTLLSPRTEARKFVEKIAADNGFISPEIWAKLESLDPELHQTIEKQFQTLSSRLGSAAITLARNLYSNNARFVFELLQNADDNHFESAKARSEKPRAHFTMYPDRIVVECNEDGFTEKNIRAICSIGESSKKGAQGYIGEKGIGFKSVFRVAYKVIIQSGHYSFSFTHHKGDSGMGMVSPVWEEVVEQVPNGITRITLMLHGQDDESPGAQQAIIEAQFKDMQEGILLFTKNLEVIKIEIVSDTGQFTHQTTYSKHARPDGLVETRKITTGDGGGNNVEITETKLFKVIKHTASNLAKNENRTYSEEETKSKAYSKGQVTVAFPLQSTTEPLVENQWIFAWMPVRKMGFNFIIHADFVTTANRQDIETTSLRNQGLADGIAQAFVRGVVQLCGHETLQYRWTSYLPSAKGPYPWDDFWAGVITKIGRGLSTTPVLRPASLGPLRLIRDLRQQAPIFNDQYGEPLFADLEDPELYLARGYLIADLAPLVEHGLKTIDISEVIARVRSDLEASESRLKHTKDRSWHSRAAELLMLPFQRSWTWMIQEVEELDLLPLETGEWVSIKSAPVYYSEASGCKIPDGLGMRLLDPVACIVPERKQLFDKLGVKTADVRDVQKRILIRQCSVLVANALLSTRDGYLRDPRKKDVYFPSSDPLSASKLLEPGSTTAGDGVPGYDVTFIRDIYLENAPKQPAGEDMTWEDWFYSFLGVRRYVRIAEKNGTGITDVCKYVAEHRPRKFLSLLKAVWPSQGAQICGSDAVVKELREMHVPCRNNSETKLARTYIPTTKLERLAARFLGDGDKFPWLELEDPPSHESHPPEWESITRDLEFGFPATDLDFMIDLLDWLLFSNGPLPLNPTLPDRVYDLYCVMEANVCGSDDHSAARKNVKNKFGSLECIYIPPTETGEARWDKPGNCIWGLPPVAMGTKVTLEHRYAERFTQFQQDSSYLAGFFTHTLGVVKWSWTHVIDEIRALRSAGSSDFDRASQLYECIDNLKLSTADAKKLRNAFDSEQLICSFVDDHPSWHTTSECLWTSATRIPGKTPLNNTNKYDELADFFLKTLGIQEMTIEMLYDKLTSDQSAASIDEHKNDLFEFSALLSTTTDKTFDRDKFLDLGKIPVKYSDGVNLLEPFNDLFVIPDREGLALDFAGKADFVDFDVDDLHRLRRFIEWAGLEHMYLSKKVREIFTADKTSTRPATRPDRDIKRKAHALLRIAVSFLSPRVAGSTGEEEFYSLLRSTQTLETNRITTRLQLNQYDESIVVEKDDGIALQIDDASADSLRVFVPRRKRDRETCFHTKLPEHLFEWIMTHPITRIVEWPANVAEGVKLVQSVLTADPCVVSSILEENGVGSVRTPCEDHVDEEEEEGDDDDEEPIQAEGSDEPGHDGEPDIEDTSDAESQPTIATPSSPPMASGSAPGEPDGFEEVISATSRNAASRTASAPRPEYAPSPLRPGTPEHAETGSGPAPRYLSLLDNVITAARSYQMPSRGAFDMSAVHAALSESTSDEALARNSPFSLRSTSQMERDKQIGAAGELFVFELLSNLDPSLPGFGRPNWQSTIRSYATLHPSYADMQPWFGRETADITYKDETGALTSLLLEQGYLPICCSDVYDYADDDDEIADVGVVRPQYFIEVKSTTGPCETPFYMSKHQYQRMQDLSQARLGNDASRFDSVYVIFRVYNLGQDSMAVKVLVDPEGMREAGELDFAAETWSIRPGLVSS